MFRYRLRTLLIAAAIVAVILAFVVRPAYEVNQRLKAEYATADVIRNVTQFVESHHGQWPKNWNDVPGGDDAQRYVRMKFDLRVDELKEDREAIHSVIVPKTGDYHIYPHAERDLDFLRDTLIRLNEQPTR